MFVNTSIKTGIAGCISMCYSTCAGKAKKYLFAFAAGTTYTTPYLLLFPLFSIVAIHGYSQKSMNAGDTVQSFTLEQCIDYGLQHQPIVNQAILNVSITRLTNAISLSTRLPQVYVSGNLTHYNNQAASFVQNTTTTATPGSPAVVTRTGVANSFNPVLSATQTIFNPQLSYIARSSSYYTTLAEQNTDSTKIYVVSAVSKSFYNLLLTLQQINVFKEDTARLTKNLNDTYRQYVAGTVDETDYDEASISLNNSKSQLKQAAENIAPQYAVLKEVMGYPPEKQFNVSFDTTRMMEDIAFDTTRQLQFDNRIQWQQLQTTRSLQHHLTNYYRSAYLPAASVFFNYAPAFENNSFTKLISTPYPYSYMGLSLSIPVFTGFARTHNVQKSQLQEKILEWDAVNLKSAIYTQYTTALASYKSNLYDFYAMKDNVTKAKRTYTIVTLQYHEGVVAYLNVITAESNLISSQIGYLNALFQVLASKIDLQTSMGILSVNHEHNN